MGCKRLGMVERQQLLSIHFSQGLSVEVETVEVVAPLSSGMPVQVHRWPEQEP